jgi:hypothetical protein
VEDARQTENITVAARPVDWQGAAATVNLGYTSFPSGESGKTETAQPGRTTKPLDPHVLGFLRFVVLLSVVIEKKYQSSLTGSVRVKYRERLARERVNRPSVAIPRKSGQSYFLILEIAHAEMMNRNC